MKQYGVFYEKGTLWLQEDADFANETIQSLNENVNYLVISRNAGVNLPCDFHTFYLGLRQKSCLKKSLQSIPELKS